STATSRSCVSARPPGVMVCRYRRLPKMTGVDMPPNGNDHATFSPEGDHFVGKFVSVERPSRLGPRHSGQSAACSHTLQTAITRLPRISRTLGVMRGS